MNPTNEQLDELWDVLEKEYKKDLAYGTIVLRLSDYGAGWEKCKMLAENWPTLLDLLDLIDQKKEPRLLLPLLNLPPEVRPYFEELFERLVFIERRVSKRRGRKTPSYRPTDHQQKILCALWSVKNRERGKTQAQEIADQAQYWGISESALKLAAQGRYPSLRAAKPAVARR
jgi:hypothetical protein